MKLGPNIINFISENLVNPTHVECNKVNKFCSDTHSTGGDTVPVNTLDVEEDDKDIC